MKITAIQMHNVRGFQTVPKTEFSKSLNIFIGANNSGKSTILNSIFLLQRQTLSPNDITIGKPDGYVNLFFSGEHASMRSYNGTFNTINFNLKTNQNKYNNDANMTGPNFIKFQEQEPQNLIYPYLSKRKTVNYDDTINEKNTNSVSGNFQNLYSKIDRLITPQFQPGNRQYIEACNDILGFEISTLPKGQGKRAVYFIHNQEHIELTAMGEGVANIIGLITDLCIANDRIFLIEEPENDIHPKALKALLKLITKKSITNQFFISTHSNIVMKYLGAVPNAKIFNVANDLRDKERPNLFVSKLTEISDCPEERRQALENLGYDFFDFDLWKAWLFLEESSAERIIRDYLIDWFVKPLKNKIRTFSANGSNNIIPKFEDFDKLFVFLHLEPVYKNKVWVIIDSGEKESEIINKMKEKYSSNGWNENNFLQFKEHDFEKYYPEEFQPKVNEILKITDKQIKRTQKKALFDEVLNWIKNDEDDAKEKFQVSAKEVIEILQKINIELN